MAKRPPRTHPAVRGFDRLAATYERGRPGYPREVVRHLARVLRLGPGSIVVELGSGTGKFTRELRSIGAAIVAVEPTPGMREVFRRTMPDVLVLDGTAEAIPLPDGFADAVVAAQAFHWFRPAPALREIARVLRPGGGLGAVWNVREESSGWARRLSEIVERYRSSGAPRSRERGWRQIVAEPKSVYWPTRRRVLHHVQRADPATFVDRLLSVSAVAVQPAAVRRRVAREMRRVLATDPRTRGRPTISLSHETEVYWTRLKRPRRARRKRRTTGTVRTGRRTA